MRQTTRLVIDLTSDEGGLTMTVTDDGVGLPADLDASRGMGLRIMRYRARMMGGTLEIRNSPGGGAIMACSVPARRIAAASDAGEWERRIWEI